MLCFGDSIRLCHRIGRKGIFIRSVVTRQSVATRISYGDTRRTLDFRLIFARGREQRSFGRVRGWIRVPRGLSLLPRGLGRRCFVISPPIWFRWSRPLARLSKESGGRAARRAGSWRQCRRRAVPAGSDMLSTDQDNLPAGLGIAATTIRSVHDLGQQPPDFLIFSARARSAWISGTSPKHFSRHANSFRWNCVLAGANE